jgi:hypothetical protein
MPLEQLSRKRGLAVGREQSMLIGDSRRCGAGVGAGLVEDGLEVTADGARADLEMFGDACISVATGDVG